MFFSKKSCPHPILRDFPWLWAVKSLWSKATRVKLYRIDSDSIFDYIVAGPDLSGRSPERVHFYVLADWGIGQEVRRFTSEQTTRDIDLYEAIDQVDKLGIDYRSIQAVVVRRDVDNCIVIYMPKEKFGLSTLFMKERQERAHRV